MSQPLLFTPLTVRDVTIRNRIVISPMCQYSANDGVAGDWHMVHLGRYATGGAGLVFTEAAAVERIGRITHGDLGIWSDTHRDALARIVGFLKTEGATPAIQLAHAGRKASMQRPWEGNGPLGAEEFARGETAWPIQAPSADPVMDGWLEPTAMSTGDIARVVQAFADSARRADEAGFEVVEIHSAHGYLCASYLSPVSNRRNDRYGGDRVGRSRFLMETVEAVRPVWPDGKPLFVRVSAVDGSPDGWSLEDTVALARDLKAAGVDVVDCSSGGISGPVTAARGPLPGPGFQVPYAEAVKQRGGIASQAVGMILEPEHAEAILQEGRADLIAIGREALLDPYWAHHAARVLQADPEFQAWPTQYGWWLHRREQAMSRA